MRKRVMVTLALAAALAFASTAFAQPCLMQGGQPDKFPMAKYLQLTDDQLVKMKDLRARYAGETRDLKYNFAMKRIEMRKLFTDPKTSDATLAAKQKELYGLRMQLMEKRGQMRLEWRKLLTPEQLSKLDRMPIGRHGMGQGGGGM